MDPRQQVSTTYNSNTHMVGKRPCFIRNDAPAESKHYVNRNDMSILVNRGSDHLLVLLFYEQDCLTTFLIRSSSS